MVRRSLPKSKVDDRNYPIRLKFTMPSGGLSAGGWRIQNWLRDELGSFDQAVHGMGHEVAFYFRRIEDAQRFVDTFPHLTLADGIEKPYGDRSPPRPVHETWCPIGQRGNG